MYEILCTHCSSKFLVRERREFDGNRARKFCSMKCSSLHNYSMNKEKILLTAFQKGHPPYLKGSRKSKIIKPPKKLYGELNHAFIHGKKCGRLPRVYLKLSKENFAQSCLICLSTQHLHVHHIDRNDLNHTLNNLCVICNSCHQRLHKLMDKEKRILHPLEAVEILKNRKVRYKFKNPNQG